jgi:hypothetical protein
VDTGGDLDAALEETLPVLWRLLAAPAAGANR